MNNINKKSLLVTLIAASAYIKPSWTTLETSLQSLSGQLQGLSSTIKPSLKTIIKTVEKIKEALFPIINKISTDKREIDALIENFNRGMEKMLKDVENNPEKENQHVLEFVDILEKAIQNPSGKEFEEVLQLIRSDS